PTRRFPICSRARPRRRLRSPRCWRWSRARSASGAAHRARRNPASLHGATGSRRPLRAFPSGRSAPDCRKASSGPRVGSIRPREAFVNPWFLVPLASALVCLASGIVILLREPDATTHRAAGALLLGAAWWGLCEALWTLAPNAEVAFALVCLSAPGWIFAGPLSLHLFATQGRTRDWLRAALPVAWAGACVSLGLAWATPWLHRAVVPAPWGWAYEVGPAFAPWYACTVAVASLGAGAALLDGRGSTWPAAGRQRTWLALALAAPLGVGSLTDGLLPLAGVQVPRLGVASFAVLGVVIAGTIRRFGWSIVAPGSFARL